MSYIKMRENFARVSPAQFMKYLDSGKDEAKSGTKSEMSYWAVPKKNFPRGLTGKFKAAEVRGLTLGRLEKGAGGSGWSRTSTAKSLSSKAWMRSGLTSPTMPNPAACLWTSVLGSRRRTARRTRLRPRMQRSCPPSRSSTTKVGTSRWRASSPSGSREGDRQSHVVCGMRHMAYVRIPIRPSLYASERNTPQPYTSFLACKRPCRQPLMR